MLSREAYKSLEVEDQQHPSMASLSPNTQAPKWRLAAFLFIAVHSAAVRCFARQWCKAVPEQGKPEYGVCVPEEFAAARYTIEVSPVVAPGVNLRYVRLIGIAVEAAQRVALLAQKRRQSRDIGVERKTHEANQNLFYFNRNREEVSTP